MELILGCKKLKMKAAGIRRHLNASLGMTENKLIVIKIKIILTFSDRGPRLFWGDREDAELASSCPYPRPDVAIL